MNNVLDFMLLNHWDLDDKIELIELLVCIYLFFSYEDQNMDYSYSDKIEREYRDNPIEFQKKAKEWKLKYTGLSKYELILIKEMEGEKVELIIEIGEKDTNKDVYFINNKEDYYYDGIKEINETDVSLLIDGKKQNFQKNLNFLKENIELF